MKTMWNLCKPWPTLSNAEAFTNSMWNIPFSFKKCNETNEMSSKISWTCLKHHVFLIGENIFFKHHFFMKLCFANYAHPYGQFTHSCETYIRPHLFSIIAGVIKKTYYPCGCSVSIVFYMSPFFPIWMLSF